MSMNDIFSFILFNIYYVLFIDFSININWYVSSNYFYKNLIQLKYIFLIYALPVIASATFAVQLFRLFVGIFFSNFLTNLYLTFVLYTRQHILFVHIYIIFMSLFLYCYYVTILLLFLCHWLYYIIVKESFMTLVLSFVFNFFYSIYKSLFKKII